MSKASALSTITADVFAYEQELRRRKIFDADTETIYEYPDNWTELEKVLRQGRDSPEPTSIQHKGFRQIVFNADNEASVMALVCPKFLEDQWFDEPGIAWQHNKL